MPPAQLQIDPGLHLQPVGYDSVQRPQDSVKTGENPQMVLYVIQLPALEYAGGHILVLDTLIGEDSRRQAAV